MSVYDGKKEGVVDLPKQLRIDPVLGAAVRFLAGVNNRTIQGQILHWVIEGVEKEERRLRQAKSDEVRFAVEPKSVRVRKSQEKSA